MPEETELRPTPETDDAARKGAYMNHGAYPETSGKQIVHIEFARRLERQRDEARAQRDRLLEALEKAVAAHVFDAAWKPAARAAIAEVKGAK